MSGRRKESGMDQSGETHPEVEKLRRNLAEHCDAATAGEIAGGVPLPPSADDKQKTAWVRHVVDALDRRFDPETIQRIRMGCHCGEAGRLGEMKTWLGGLYRAASGLEDFVAKVNEHGAGWHLEGGTICTKFPRCECRMVQGIDILPSDTWCKCTVGYTRNLFEHIFGRPVKCELTQSIKRGANHCVVKVTPS